jgi:pimeloyl-ACP methyl ester carboxylesterase
MPAPIIMVHGAFCGGWAFEAFKTPFEKAGHVCTAPDLPGHGRLAGRAGPIGASMSDYARAVADLAADCDRPPILVGHSLGGLVVQMAAMRAPVSGLILLSPSAPWGVAADTMSSATVSLGLMSHLGAWTGLIEPDRKLVTGYGLDRVDRDAREALYAQMTPESSRALWETFNWWLDPFLTTQVDTARIDAPVLTLAGRWDMVNPPSTAALVNTRLGGRLEIVPNMSHWLVGEPGWRKVADICLGWMSSAKRAAA